MDEGDEQQVSPRSVLHERARRPGQHHVEDVVLAGRPRRARTCGRDTPLPLIAGSNTLECQHFLERQQPLALGVAVQPRGSGGSRRAPMPLPSSPSLAVGVAALSHASGVVSIKVERDSHQRNVAVAPRPHQRGRHPWRPARRRGPGGGQAATTPATTSPRRPRSGATDASSRLPMREN